MLLADPDRIFLAGMRGLLHAPEAICIIGAAVYPCTGESIRSSANAFVR
jgi:hypothetical protein